MSLGEDGKVNFYDILSKSSKGVIGHEHSVASIEFSSDKSQFFTVGDGTLNIWKMGKK